MKRFAIIVLLAAAVGLLPAAAQADTVTLQDWTTGDFAANGGNGGPFRATTAGPLLGDGSFMTFCIEYNQTFNYGVTYNFTLADTLTDSTRWLYYQALTGGYASWYATATGSALGSNVGANLQYAFWYLEGQRTLAEIGGSGSNAYEVAAYAIANQNWGDLYAAGNRVYAMKLVSVTGAPVQDQLAHTVETVPEPGSTLLYSSSILGMLLAWRRRRG